MSEAFPIGGPRQAVYDALRSRGFVMSGFSDKWWQRADGLEAHVYGSGSRLRLRRESELEVKLADGPMAEVLRIIDDQYALLQSAELPKPKGKR
jgi:hypothetical protein